MLIVKTLLLPPSLKWALGRWVRDVLKIRDLLPPPPKNKNKNNNNQAIQRYERWSCLLHSRKGDLFVHIDFTCTHGGGNDCKRHVKSILLLSLNAHSHVDDYSGTLGSVRKGHISALVTSPKNWVVALSFFLCLCLCLSLSLSKKKEKRKRKKKKKRKRKKRRTNELVDWSVGGTWHKSVNSRCLYCINGEWVPVATKIMNLLKKSLPPCLKLLEAKWGEGQQDIIRAEAMKCHLLVVKTCNHHSPWIYWCF